jgi:pyroglutamyl-peptidase
MRVLLTAFDSYDQWPTNSSWMALVEYLRTRQSSIELTTRRYPVELSAMQAKLNEDLQRGYDAVMHLGQAPGAGVVRLESIALNIGGLVDNSNEELGMLVASAPLAYRSSMPIGRWVEKLRQARVPACVSYHAGTYLCNAIMYLSHHWFAQQKLDVPVGFMHLPLASEQVSSEGPHLPSLPLSTLSRAIDVVMSELEGANSPSNLLV